MTPSWKKSAPFWKMSESFQQQMAAAWSLYVLVLFLGCSENCENSSMPPNAVCGSWEFAIEPEWCDSCCRDHGTSATATYSYITLCTFVHCCVWFIALQMERFTFGDTKALGAWHGQSPSGSSRNLFVSSSAAENLRWNKSFLVSDKVRSCSVELVSRYLRLISADGHEFFLDSVQMLSTVNSHHLYHLSPPFGSRQNRKDRRIAYECDTFKKMVEKAAIGTYLSHWNSFPPEMCQVVSCIGTEGRLQRGSDQWDPAPDHHRKVTGEGFRNLPKPSELLKLRHVVTLLRISSPFIAVCYNCVAFIPFKDRVFFAFLRSSSTCTSSTSTQMQRRAGNCWNQYIP